MTGVKEFISFDDWAKVLRYRNSLKESIVTHESESESVIAGEPESLIGDAETADRFLNLAVEYVAVELGHKPNEAINGIFFDLLADFLFMLLDNCQANSANRIRAIARRARRRDIIQNAEMLRKRNDDVRFRESFRVTRAVFKVMAEAELNEIENLILEVRLP